MKVSLCFTEPFPATIECGALVVHVECFCIEVGHSGSMVYISAGSLYLMAHSMNFTDHNINICAIVMSDDLQKHRAGLCAACLGFAVVVLPDTEIHNHKEHFYFHSDFFQIRIF